MCARYHSCESSMAIHTYRMHKHHPNTSGRPTPSTMTTTKTTRTAGAASAAATRPSHPHSSSSSSSGPRAWPRPAGRPSQRAGWAGRWRYIILCGYAHCRLVLGSVLVVECVCHTNTLTDFFPFTYNISPPPSHPRPQPNSHHGRPGGCRSWGWRPCWRRWPRGGARRASKREHRRARRRRGHKAYRRRGGRGACVYIWGCGCVHARAEAVCID